VAESLKIQYREINIGDILECYKHSLEIYDPKNKLPTGNLKARIRMTVLYYHANSMNRLVAGTGNKTELMVGYFTKYGDGGVDILPLGGLYKTDVYGLAEHLGVPDRIIRKTPTAGLWPGQTDEEEMGITYRELDSILKEIESGDDIYRISKITGFSLDMVEKVFKMVEESSHKRLLPPSAEIPDDLKEER
jgi:NAD+ synthase